MNHSVLASMASLDVAEVSESLHREHANHLKENFALKVYKDPRLDDKARLEKIELSQHCVLIDRVALIMQRL